MISTLSKLSNRQPIQELAFHKEQWEINGVPFECHESYYEGELLNGVDLRIKAVRGLSNRDRTYDYLQDSQQLVFAASAHIMVYNTHRRNYHQLFSLQGEVELLCTHLEKMNSREYILWVETFPDGAPPTVQTHTNRIKAHSRIAKRTGSINHRPSPTIARGAKTFLKSIFSLSPELSVGQENCSKGPQQEEGCHMLRVYDYTRKEVVFEGALEIGAGQTLKEVFLFMNHYKIVGYVTEHYETNMRYIHYQNIDSKAKSPADPFTMAEPAFTSFCTSKNIERLLFNSELNYFFFAHGHTLNVLCIRQDSPDADHQLFKQFLSLSEGKPKQQEGGKAVRLEVTEFGEFQEQVLSLAINEQYLAILTARKIYFHSAFDTSCLIFTHILDPSPREPLSIEFNKSALMLTYRGSASILSFVVKGKALRLAGESRLDMSHCKEILRIYTNSISAEVFCVVRFYELQSRDRPSDLPPPSLATELLEGLVQYAAKPASVDFVASFLTPAGAAEAVALGVSKRRFRRVHGCAWLSGYVVETEQAVELGVWREIFENKKCAAVHPSGLFLVVCLKQAFRIYVITQQGFGNSYRGDSLKDIQACAISPEGNHLAICSPNVIHIYDFYSCSKLRTLSLPFGLAIEAVEFSGHTLVCHLKSKKVYLYDSLNEYREIFIFNPKAFLNDPTVREEQATVSALLAMTVSQIVTMVTFSPFYYCPLLNFFIYSYQTAVYFFNCTTNAVHTTVDLEPLSCIHYCPNLATLFLGTVAGEVICFSWPNKPSSLQGDQRRFKLHAGRIVDIRVTSDLRELITVGEDEALVVCSLVAVRNLKRFEGLELIEHLSGSIRICYDFLARRGLALFTHGKMADKCDELKDCEDEVLNANFILPEERQKQKEQMFANVKTNMKDIAEGNQFLYDTINKTTNEARDLVNKVRSDFTEFAHRREREKEEMQQAMYGEYIKHYEASEAALQEQKRVAVRLAEELALTRRQLADERRKEEEECRRKYAQLEGEQQAQVRGWHHEDPAELAEIDAEKREFLGANLGALDEVVAELNNSNGVLACRNNNLEKEITDLRRKMEEHGYLLYRLEGSTGKLREEQGRYQGLKTENKRLVEREDRINLAEIERRYVKQTQTLIERDKEINVQLVNHEKEKNILIHLEKCLESVEGSIENLVGNILQEKKQRKEELLRIDAARQQASTVNADMIAAKKEKISSRNQLHNYLCKLEAIVDDVVHTRSKHQLLQLLRDRELIDAEPLPASHSPQEKELLSKLLSEKVQTTRPVGSKPAILRTGGRPNGSLRMLKTEASETSGRGGSGRRELLAATCREAIERQSKDVYMKLDAEQKQYERIKTEQLVFENTRKKFNLENQDLIENYNTLAMENHKFVTALRRQQSLSRMPARRERVPRGEGSPTPFQMYLQNKANGHSQRAFVPAASYQPRLDPTTL